MNISMSLATLIWISAALNVHALEPSFKSRFGVVGVAEFAGDEFFDYETRSFLTPGLGIAYDLSVRPTHAWVFDVSYQFKKYRLQTEPVYSDGYMKAWVENDSIYQMFHDKSYREHAVTFRFAPVFVFWKHFDLGLGAEYKLKAASVTGSQDYQYWYPERTVISYYIIPATHISWNMDYGARMGAEFGKVRMDVSAGDFRSGFGYKATFFYYPWKSGRT